MAVVVYKFGGTSLGTLERIQVVAQLLKQAVASGHQLVVVVSAMDGETDRLLGLAKQIASVCDEGFLQERDALLACGEQACAALLAMQCCAIGCAAQSFNALQLPMQSNATPARARLTHINTQALRANIDQQVVSVVTGFQAVSAIGRLTTLGRGGSDTTAVAMAAALGAKECRIYTDVRGVYSADPRVIHGALLREKIHIDVLMAMSHMGAKVIDRRAIECAARHQVALRILSSFESGPGTVVFCDKEQAMEMAAVTAIVIDRDQVRFTIQSHDLSTDNELTQVLDALASAGVAIDLVQWHRVDGRPALSFVIAHDAAPLVEDAISHCQGQGQSLECATQSAVAKLSLVGWGIGTCGQMVATTVRCLSRIKGDLLHLMAAENRLTLVVPLDEVEHMAQHMHDIFVKKHSDAELVSG